MKMDFEYGNSRKTALHQNFFIGFHWFSRVHDTRKLVSFIYRLVFAHLTHNRIKTYFIYEIRILTHVPQPDTLWGVSA